MQIPPSIAIRRDLLPRGGLAKRIRRTEQRGRREFEDSIDTDVDAVRLQLPLGLADVFDQCRRRRDKTAKLVARQRGHRRDYILASMVGLAPKRARESQITMTQQMLPSEANPYGNVHGGVIMKLIDSAAGACAGRHARQRVVTARIDELSFVAPVVVGDLVYAKASVNDVGTTSMEVGVRVEA